MVNKLINWQGCEGKWSRPVIRFGLGICINPQSSSPCPVLDSNRGSPEYKSGTLLLQLNFSGR
jgi:hypothetical protein